MATPYQDEVEADNPVGYWPDCETGVLGDGRHLTRNTGTAGAAISGDTGEVVCTLNGTTQYCKRDLDAAYTNTTVTLECLIRTPASFQTGGVLSLIPQNTAGVGKGVHFYMYDLGGGLTGGLAIRKGKSDSSGFVWTVMDDFPLAPSTEYHFVAVCGPSIFKIYVDAVLRKDDSSSAHNIFWADGGGFYPNPGQVYIGGDRTADSSPDNTSPNTSFGKFEITQPAIYSGELSAARVTAHFEASGLGAPPPAEIEIAASLPALVAAVSLDAGIPAPVSVTVNHPSQTQNVPFNVNWTAVTGADSYEVKYSKGGAAQVMISAAAVGTSVVFTPTQTGTYVFYVRTNIDGEYSEQTASVTVTVTKKRQATFGAITVLTAGTGDLSGEVEPDGTVRGVVVGIVQSLTDGGSVDEIASVTYGGVALERVATVAHNQTEDGRIYLYFLGSNIPTGAQTVAVTASGTTAEKVAFVFTILSTVDTILHAFDTLSSGSVANPSDTLPLGGLTSFVGLFGFAGRDAVTNTTPIAGWTDSAEADQGSSVALAYRYLAVDNVDVVYGWTQAADDAAAIAFAVSAVPIVAAVGSTYGITDITSI